MPVRSYCQVRIQHGQDLRLEVCDDGAGMPEGWRAGVGITAMRERVAELGGELDDRARRPARNPHRRPSAIGDRQMTEPIRVLIADDHPLFRDGLAALLRAAARHRAGRRGRHRHRSRRDWPASTQPDVVVMDLRMPGLNGVEATRRIVADSPHTSPCWCLTMFDDDDSVFAALRAGARGYLLKGAGQEQIRRAVCAAASGEVVFGAPLAARMLAYFTATPAPPPVFPQLTDREREVLELVAQGRPNTAIAARLQVSQKTARNHVSNILTKLQVADRAQAIVRARDAGLGHQSRA